MIVIKYTLDEEDMVEEFELVEDAEERINELINDEETDFTVHDFTVEDVKPLELLEVVSVQIVEPDTEE